MDNQIEKERYGWYLPTFLKRWRERAANEDVDDLTRLVAMNHQDAVVEIEEVDLSFLLSCIEEEIAEATETDEDVVVEASDLIDKFLSLDDFRIVPPEEEDSEVDIDWELVDVENQFDTKEELASEELAEIFMKQGLYDEAKEIYSKLSLQYSEKSIYFAELTNRLTSKTAKQEGEKEKKRGKEGSVGKKGGKKKNK